ncbi:HEAT repeat domain-containing protein [Endozoicomonas sp. SM1973]|uniref:HEAT repeat domain-containing protein n=1 Tax=Spartinivicinus marinus TaxID=2994442 RepID=A0A853IDQ1_9GAMM|nr:HEAT repeat domain-containing protein [Spartinivicinus marinus]MCX4025862.1 HEAT repeat domain-containing protein [Spartinivicinus marinus]NYZ68678.1 HEAT repeat domain-containing protein [Spartinivicinus marinus]
MSAAENLAEYAENNTLVQASLIKALTSDDEEDVRKVALESLSQLTSDISTIACIIGLFDSDSGVRYDALEGLRWKNLELAKFFSAKLVNDEDDAVKNYAQAVLDLDISD